MNWYWIAGIVLIVAVLVFAVLPYYRKHKAPKGP